MKTDPPLTRNIASVTVSDLKVFSYVAHGTCVGLSVTRLSVQTEIIQERFDGLP